MFIAGQHLTLVEQVMHDRADGYTLEEAESFERRYVESMADVSTPTDSDILFDASAAYLIIYSDMLKFQALRARRIEVEQGSVGYFENQVVLSMNNSRVIEDLISGSDLARVVKNMYVSALHDYHGDQNEIETLFFVSSLIMDAHIAMRDVPEARFTDQRAELRGAYYTAMEDSLNLYNELRGLSPTYYENFSEQMVWDYEVSDLQTNWPATRIMAHAMDDTSETYIALRNAENRSNLVYFSIASVGFMIAGIVFARFNPIGGAFILGLGIGGFGTSTYFLSDLDTSEQIVIPSYWPLVRPPLSEFSLSRIRYEFDEVDPTDLSTQ